MIVEWNAHIFSRDENRFPFHKEARYIPDIAKHSGFEVINLDDAFDSYLKRMVIEDIDRAVLVQPEPYGDDHTFILECLNREQKLIKGTCLFYPRDPQAMIKMERLVRRQPRIIAIRFHATNSLPNIYMDSLEDPGVKSLWKKALELGLIIELHIGPKFALQAAKMINRYPESVVLIDHLAEPHLGNAVEYENVLKLSNFENVYMKISELNHIAEDPPLYLSVKPFIKRVIETFGPDRMVWGGGTHKILDAHLDGYSETECLLVKGNNLARLLNFE